jgi:ubiquinone/menaquinone biosynthesis C-methylase UbiE
MRDSMRSIDEKETVTRFSDRVENYIRYRPGYPQGVVDLLVEECGVNANATVADIGAGTGIFTALLLPVAHTVYAVEPNDAMRTAMDTQLAKHANYHSVNGTSTATGLTPDSIDCITAAQAFHWFNRKNTRQEFQRISRPGCHLAIIFNERQNDTPFLKAYEQALETYANDYSRVTQKNLSTDDYAPFFTGNMQTAQFANSQLFDLDGVLGRLSSSSYCPKPGEPNHQPLWEAVSALFEQYNVDGYVELSCPTTVYWGTLAEK